jgi:hypothetical protein
MIRLCFIGLLFPLFVNAQTIDIKDVNADSSGEDTVIENTTRIRKGKIEDAKTGSKVEVHENEATIEGENGATNNDAIKEWKKACADWKKELKTEHGKDLVSSDCGEKTCSGNAGSKVCSSKGFFKLKVRQE